jgi:SAM-dependent methyltransferase
MAGARPGENPLARVAATFDLVAEVYDSGPVEWFRPIAARLVELVAPAPGEHVVDVGAGADVLTASLVLFFSPDPAATLRTWLACLRPGGRLGLTTFGEEDEAFQRLDALFEPFLPPAMLDARTSGRRGPFASAAATEALVAGCGAVAVATVEETVEVAFRDVAQWRDWTRSHGCGPCGRPCPRSGTGRCWRGRPPCWTRCESRTV